MDFQTVTSLIGSVGFPIVACVYLATTMNKTLENNTNILTKLYTMLDRYLPKEDEQ